MSYGQEYQPSVRHFKNFGSKCYIKTNDDHLGKFQNKIDEGIFLGCSTERRDYKFYNNWLKRMGESMYVRVDEELSPNLEEEEVDCDSSNGEDENETVKTEEEQEKQDPSSTCKK